MNRIVRWTKNGYETEADPRHCKLVVKQLGVENLKPRRTLSCARLWLRMIIGSWRGFVIY